jgi:hypothetical protein
MTIRVALVVSAPSARQLITRKGFQIMPSTSMR